MGNTLEGTAGHADVMIIGGGPTGLGAAYRLNQHGNENWILLDAEKQPGGLAGSIKTHEGFRFDHGYKSFFSRYDYLDRLLEDCYSSSTRKLTEKARDNYVYVRGRMVRFPLQNNLSGLPADDRLSCAIDLLRAKIIAKNTEERPNEFAADNENKELQQALLEENKTVEEGQNDADSEQKDKVSGEEEIQTEKENVFDNENESFDVENLDEYLVRVWGESLSNILFRPYIFKSFAFPTSKLSANWAEYKISPSQMGDDIDRLLNDEQSDPGLDSDAGTLYPSQGGLVSLWKGLVRKLPKENVRFKSEIVELDIEEKIVRIKDGLEINYDTLISTMPITSLLELAGRGDLSESLVHSSLHIICLGLRGTSPHKDITGCIYFPESDCVFHRACVFSSYDPDSVPDKDETIPTMRLASEEDGLEQSSIQTGPYWSLLLEVSGGPLKTVHDSTIMNEVIRDACSVGLLQPNNEIVSIHMTEMTHGQPLPTLDCEKRTEEALKWLQSKGIYSRGRFGSFRYHIGDLDHCIIQGVEAVDNILNGTPERCLWASADEVNCRDNKKIHHPVYDIYPEQEDVDGQVINAGAVRNAITREPNSATSSYAATTSPSTHSISSSSQQDDSSQISDTETTSSVSTKEA